MTLFTPVHGLVGGAIIGLAAATMLVLNGDIMGASGITSTAVLNDPNSFELQSWKFVFMASFAIMANLYKAFVDQNVVQDPPEAGWVRTPTWLGWILAGLFVGFGTKLGNGCTSGHGICGLARFSKRSLVSVCSFMMVAMMTATLLEQTAVQNVLSFLMAQPTEQEKQENASASLPSNVCVGILLSCAPTIVAVRYVASTSKTLGAALGGALFALGLAISTMVLRSKVLGFLDISGLWHGTYDPTLMTVMAGGLVVSFLGYTYKNHSGIEKPILCDRFNVPTNTVIDANLLVGASCFGVGWGIAGLCPGPAMFWAFTGVNVVVFLWLPAYLAGAYLATHVYLPWRQQQQQQQQTAEATGLAETEGNNYNAVNDKEEQQIQASSDALSSGSSTNVRTSILFSF